MVGGSSNHNNMIYLRGFASDFDGWAELTGHLRWAYKNVLPTFRKMETCSGSYETGNWIMDA